ncbi:MAG: urease accessory protein UreF [Pseudobacteriovorax sp.]|nr:urease accessory protein UreF [Pseudobacteriovorax sp.]
MTSPNLPIGGFSWSQGLEGAVSLGLVADQESLCQWLETVLSKSLVYNELATMSHAYQASSRQDAETLAHLDHLLMATKETKELRDESLQMGKALQKMLRETHPEIWLSLETYSYEVLFAEFVQQQSVPIDVALAAFVWSWLENQVMAATRLISIGQVATQKILVQFQQTIPSLVTQSQTIGEDDIGFSLPSLFFSSACHESQYSRLFRS